MQALADYFVGISRNPFMSAKMETDIRYMHARMQFMRRTTLSKLFMWAGARRIFTQACIYAWRQRSPDVFRSNRTKRNSAKRNHASLARRVTLSAVMTIHQSRRSDLECLRVCVCPLLIPVESSEAQCRFQRCPKVSRYGDGDR